MLLHVNWDFLLLSNFFGTETGISVGPTSRSHSQRDRDDQTIESEGDPGCITQSAVGFRDLVAGYSAKPLNGESTIQLIDLCTFTDRCCAVPRCLQTRLFRNQIVSTRRHRYSCRSEAGQCSMELMLAETLYQLCYC